MLDILEIKNIIMLDSVCRQTEDGHLLARVCGQIEDEDGEEGDPHAGDDQVHLHRFLSEIFLVNIDTIVTVLTGMTTTVYLNICISMYKQHLDISQLFARFELSIT